jgi:hypothetical protein
VWVDNDAGFSSWFPLAEDPIEAVRVEERKRMHEIVDKQCSDWGEASAKSKLHAAIDAIPSAGEPVAKKRTLGAWDEAQHEMWVRCREHLREVGMHDASEALAGIRVEAPHDA